MGDLTLQHVVLRICAGLLIVSVHGGAVSAIASVLGDPGPRDDGRLGWNPFRHLDLLGGLVFVLFTYGWITPVAIDPDRLRPGRSGLVATVIGAACATIAVAELLRLIRPVVLNMLPDTAAATFFIFVETVAQLSVSFALFNILPLPPLTGQHLLVAAFPRQLDTIRRAQPYFAAVLALLIVSGAIARLFGPAELLVRRAVLDG